MQQLQETKAELLAVAKGLRLCHPDSVEAAVAFIAGESLGYWHNRARAKFARRLKHCPLQAHQAQVLVTAIVGRLVSGRFSEQFSDQLRLALQLDRTAVLMAAQVAAESPAAHVRRYARWVLAHHGDIRSVR